MANQPATPTLRVGSFNIYNTTGRYAAGRRALLRVAVAELSSSGAALDVCGLQEVAFAGVESQTALFTGGDAGGFSRAFEARLSEPLVAPCDPTFRIDGNAMLVSSAGGWSVVPGSHATLELSRHRVAHRLRLIHAGAEVEVANTHLHWAVDTLGLCDRADAKIRGEQMAAVLRWLEEIRDCPVVLVGDLNVFYPEEPIHQMLDEAGFASAYAKVHGAHVKTCPTPLRGPGCEPYPYDMVCDFVLVRQALTGALSKISVTPIAATIAADQHAAGDPTLYPSDHYAVTATIAFGE